MRIGFHTDAFNSIEREGAGGPLLERSLAWLRATLAELDIAEAHATA